MHFQWYPGHMTKARRMMQENITFFNVVKDGQLWGNLRASLWLILWLLECIKAFHSIELH